MSLFRSLFLVLILSMSSTVVAFSHDCDPSPPPQDTLPEPPAGEFSYFNYNGKSYALYVPAPGESHRSLFCRYEYVLDLPEYTSEQFKYIADNYEFDGICPRPPN
jgi:hypothetical protein